MQSDPARPIDRRTVQRALKIAVRRTDIHKRVSPRTLRHSFATRPHGEHRKSS
jgi:site-specific recombinase XerD